jgi:hypothetical protein
MPVETVKVGPGTISVGDVGSEVDFSAQVLSAVVSWSKDKEDDRKVLTGETVVGATKRSATISVTVLQDLANAAGLVRFSWESKGEEHDFRYVPNTVADVEITGTVTVEPVDVGGEVDSDAESEFEWDFVGEPVLADITP